MRTGSTLGTRSSAAFNLWKKLEWMSRRLRWTDEAALIQDWVAAMDSVYNLMQRIANNTEVYKDCWKPWSCHTQLEQHPQMSKSCDERGERASEKNQIEWNEIMTRQRKLDCAPPVARKRPRSDTTTTNLSKARTRALGQTEERLVKRITGSTDVDMEEPVVQPPRVETENVDTELEIRMPLPPRIDTDEVAKGVVTRVRDKCVDLNSQLKLKYKAAYREALWRRLSIETKKKEHWEDMKNFVSLLDIVERDTQLVKQSKELFSDNYMKKSLGVISNKELLSYLFIEMNNFFLLQK